MSGYADKTRRPPRTLTDRELRQLLKVTGQHREGFRDHMILSLAIGTGLRISEIVALDVGDVCADLKKRTPRWTIQLRTFKRAGAGADPQDHRVHLPEATRYKLQKYLRTAVIVRGEPAPTTATPLFRSREGARLSVRRVREMFDEWQTRAGFDSHYNFHSLRHTAITLVRRGTGDIRIAQKFARHTNIGTTVRYEHASDEELARAVRGLPG